MTKHPTPVFAAPIAVRVRDSVPEPDAHTRRSKPTRDGWLAGLKRVFSADRRRGS